MNSIAPITTLPLTAAQLEFWELAEDIEPPSLNSYAAEYLEIHGNINVPLFEKSLRQLINDTDILRVIFIRDADGHPKQLMYHNIGHEWSLPYFDFSKEDNPENSALEWMKTTFSKTTDLSQWPLFTLALFKISHNRFFWLQGYPHIMIDGFALMLLAKRAAAIYTSFVNGKTPERHQFLPLSRLIEEDEKYRSSEKYHEDKCYWHSLFSDAPLTKTLAGNPLIDSRGLLPDLRVIHHLAPEETNKLYGVINKTLQATLPQLAIAVMAAYMHLMTHIEDIVLSIVTMSRMESAERRIPGMNANMLPFRITIKETMNIMEINQQVARNMLQLKKHQRYRGGILANELHCFNNEQGVFGAEVNVMCFKYNIKFAELRSTAHNVAAGTTDDMMVNLSDRRDSMGLRVDIDASPEYYTNDKIKNHLNAFLNLLVLSSENTKSPIYKLSKSFT